ncbi:DEAD/DEAH box helicase [Pokkaliibacter sp. CJK22405]|uniref:DEAD/DEAH box helicase n=1 Tax=Pokkaliibacter sp. CJK22405 TaxID=3384615 RepID=UPI0039850A1B
MSAQATTLNFADLGLPEFLLEPLATMGYESPSPIQAQSIPALLKGKDMLGQAQTGTGKTAAFALPLLAKIDLKNNAPQALILTPTRELALQVTTALEEYASKMRGIRILSVYGGQDYRTQLRGLRDGVHVVVGTPGRVMDHMERGTLKLDDLKTLVLDEADEMLKMGFIDDVEWILEKTPATRQIALFSATMPQVIREVADRHLRDAEQIKIHSKTATVSSIEQLYVEVSGHQKFDALARLLEVEEFDGLIIFARTKSTTQELADKLDHFGYRAAALHGDLSQPLREKVVDRLKENKIDIIVATDVAARGLDVERISHVVNYDLPMDREAYVHRVGRTGRAGRDGRALVLITPRERRSLQALERHIGKSLDRYKLPTKKEMAQLRETQFLKQVLNSMEDARQEEGRNILSRLCEEQGVSLNDVAAALYWMARDSKAAPRSTDVDIIEHEARRGANDRGGRNNERGEPRERRQRPQDTEPMTRYRIALGRDQRVEPRDIVGAIANEAGISGSRIGHIKLYGNYSTVYLPENLNANQRSALTGCSIRNQSMELSPWAEGPDDAQDRGPRRPRQDRGAPRRRDDRPAGNREDRFGGKREDRFSGRSSSRQR